MKCLRWLPAIILLLLMSCGGDEDEDDNPSPMDDPMDDPIEDPTDPSMQLTPIYSVLDTNVQKTVSSFFDEAFFRSVTIDTTNLIIRYDSTLVANNCTLISRFPADGEVVQNEIVINPLIPKWTNEQEREAFWFHMLGHVLLNREHDDSLLPNNQDPKSIMFGGFLSFFGGCVYAINNTPFCNRSGRREYYIDELFLPNTPVPSWGN